VKIEKCQEASSA